MAAHSPTPPELPPVRLAITPTPSQVRIARLVAVAVARKFGVSTELLDEIRLAVGEACARAIAAMQGAAPTVGSTQGDQDLVELSFSLTSAGDKPDRLTVTILDRASQTPSELGHLDQWESIARDDTDQPPLAPFLLAGLVDDVVITPAPDGPGTVVAMSWPAVAASFA